MALRQDLFNKWMGLMGDNPQKGSLTKAVNVTVEDGGAYLETRGATTTVLGPISCAQSRGVDSMHELILADGTKNILLDVVSVSSGGALVRKVIGAENISTGNEIEFDSVSVVLASVSVSGVPSYCTARNKAFRADGNTQNYAISALNNYSSIGVAAPTSISASNTTGGSILPGDYRVYVVDVKDEGNGYFHRSNPSVPVDVTVTGNAISVTVAATSNPDVTNKWIYRTIFDGQYRNAYRALAISNISTTVTLTADDDSINTQTGIYIIDVEGGNSQLYGVPPKSDFLMYAQDRMFYGVKSESRLYYSEIGFPESVGTTNYTTPFEAGDGDELVGGLAFQNSLLIFKKYKTFIVDLLAQDYPSTKLSSRIGCIDSRTIKATGSKNSAIWLSGEGVQLYSNGEIVNITTGRIYKTILRPYIMNGANFIGEYYPDRNQYHLMMYYRNSGGTEITSAQHLVFSLNSGEWTEFYDEDGDTGAQLAAIASVILTNGFSKQVFVTAFITVDGVTFELKQWDVLDSEIFGFSWYDRDYWGADINYVKGVSTSFPAYGSPTPTIFTDQVIENGSAAFASYVQKTLDNPLDPSARLKDQEGVGYYIPPYPTFYPATDIDLYELTGSTLPVNAGITWALYEVALYDTIVDAGELWVVCLVDYRILAGAPCGWQKEWYLIRFYVGSDGSIAFNQSERLGFGELFDWEAAAEAAGWPQSNPTFETVSTIDLSGGAVLSFSPSGTSPRTMNIVTKDGYTLTFLPTFTDWSGTEWFTSNLLFYNQTYGFLPDSVDSGDKIRFCIDGNIMCSIDKEFYININRDTILSNWNSSAEMLWHSPEFHIQTAFDDFGAPHLKKTLQKIQLPISANNPMCGLVHVQPDFTEQNYIGITDFAATPRYSSSPICHEGTTAVDTNGVFSTEEQVRQESMGMNVSGKKLRIAIRGGTAGQTTGQMKIFPPVFHVKYWGQQDRDKRG